MKAYFLDLVEIIRSSLTGEHFTTWFSGETLDFARFNHGLIRQAGTIDQNYLDLNLIDGQKHATINLGLSGNLVEDRKNIEESLKFLRAQLRHAVDDPFLLVHESNTEVESIVKSEMAEKLETVSTIIDLANGLDLVGCYFGGPVYRGFASSFGQINWFQKSSFVVDTSIYHSGDKAIKQSYADIKFNADIFRQKIESARLGLQLFDKDTVALSPGHYDVYFSPSALYELISMLNWQGFSRKAIEVKNSPLLPAFMGNKTFAKNFVLSENIEAGVGPNFQAQGFLKPNHLTMIENGTIKNTLISPKTAKEYRLDHNGADEMEGLTSIEVKAGELSDEEILPTLRNGLYVNNLWYLNFSDRQNGCLTGMTRFFCYVVEDAQPKRAFGVMRFDDSIYRLFGENLRHLTKNRELVIDTGTYDERSTSCALLPGIIAENVRFTL